MDSSDNKNYDYNSFSVSFCIQAVTGGLSLKFE